MPQHASEPFSPPALTTAFSLDLVTKQVLGWVLVVVALLVIALPAVAGDYKVHGWSSRTTPYRMLEVPKKINVVLAHVGFSFRILNQSPIKVEQDTDADDPYRTYTGCAENGVLTNFPTDVKVTIAGSGSLAGGDWSVTMEIPGEADAQQITVSPGRTTFRICVQGKNINLGALTGGARSVHVADITIRCCPR